MARRPRIHDRDPQVAEWNNKIGARVRLARTKMGWSQTQLGDALGISFQQIQKYERGANRISCGTLIRIAQLLNEPVMTFFEGLDNSEPGEDAGTSRKVRRMMEWFPSLAEHHQDVLIKIARELQRSSKSG